MSNSDVFSAILGQQHKVKLPDGEITLIIPTADQIVDLHKKMHAEKDETTEITARRTLEGHGHALILCSGVDLDLESAIRIIMVTGGITGELGRKVMQLCGFGVTSEMMLPHDRPTS